MMSLGDQFPWLRDAIGVLEPAATIGSGMAAEALSGLTAPLELARTGSVADTVKSMQALQEALTYMPRTAAGQSNLQQVGQWMNENVQPYLDEASKGYDRAMVQPYQQMLGPELGSGLAAGWLAGLEAVALPARVANRAGRLIDTEKTSGSLRKGLENEYNRYELGQEIAQDLPVDDSLYETIMMAITEGPVRSPDDALWEASQAIERRSMEFPSDSPQAKALEEAADAMLEDDYLGPQFYKLRDREGLPQEVVNAMYENTWGYLESRLSPINEGMRKKIDDWYPTREGFISSVEPHKSFLVPEGPQRQYGRSTIRGAERKAYPGIYDNPSRLLEQAESMVPDEDPMLGRLFDISRAEMAELGNTPGNIPGNLPGAAPNPKGSAAAERVMKPANTRRLVEALETARGGRLAEGMEGWYWMEPAYQRILELTGDVDEANRLYTQFNRFSGMASPGANVLTEINRGTAANWLAEQGRFDDFLRYGGLRGSGPEDMADVLGHAYHKTAHGTPMSRLVETGELQMGSPKVPLYIDASGSLATGRQTEFPVGDAHWSRAVGLGDTRTAKDYGKSFSNPEAQQLAPWWRDEVAAEVGLESVPAQALAWGLFAPQTGVDTAVGVPKLELLSQQIAKRARTRGVTPEQARDDILLGKDHAGYIDQELLKYLGLGAGATLGGSLLLDDSE